MSISVWLAVLRDVVIVAGIGFILWFVMHAEHNADQLRDMKTSLKQIQANQATADRWHEEQTHANETTAAALLALGARVDAERAHPVIVRQFVPQGATTAAGALAAEDRLTDPGRSAPRCDQTVRSVDVGPMLADFERKYGEALIRCQGVLDAWPH